MIDVTKGKFESPLEIHGSQTDGLTVGGSLGLSPLWKYTALKRTA